MQPDNTQPPQYGRRTETILVASLHELSCATSAVWDDRGSQPSDTAQPPQYGRRPDTGLIATHREPSLAPSAAWDVRGSPPSDTSMSDDQQQGREDTSWQWQGMSEREEDEEQRRLTRMRRTHASWPTTESQKKKVKRHHTSSAYLRNYLPDEHRQRCLDSLATRYASVEGYIRYGCLHAKPYHGKPRASENYSEQFIQHAISLWHSTGGICAATGRQMVWRQADVKQYPGDAVVPVSKSPDNQALDGSNAYNVTLVCRSAAPFIRWHFGLAPAQAAAMEIVQFVLFKRDRPEMTFSDVCKAWDVECHKNRKSRLWNTESAGDWHAFRHRMTRSRCNSSLDRQSPSEATTLANHAVELMIAQAGRCAVSGVRMTLPAGDPHTQASLDRIDGRQRHVLGNVRLTTLAMNSARLNTPDEEFDDMIVRMARCSSAALSERRTM
jgi:hypothetical protein